MKYPWLSAISGLEFLKGLRLATKMVNSLLNPLKPGSEQGEQSCLYDLKPIWPLSSLLSLQCHLLACPLSQGQHHVGIPSTPRAHLLPFGELQVLLQHLLGHISSSCVRDLIQNLEKADKNNYVDLCAQCK